MADNDAIIAGQCDCSLVGISEYQCLTVANIEWKGKI